MRETRGHGNRPCQPDTQAGRQGHRHTQSQRPPVPPGLSHSMKTGRCSHRNTGLRAGVCPRPRTCTHAHGLWRSPPGATSPLDGQAHCPPLPLHLPPISWDGVGVQAGPAGVEAGRGGAAPPRGHFSGWLVSMPTVIHVKGVLPPQALEMVQTCPPAQSPVIGSRAIKALRSPAGKTPPPLAEASSPHTGSEQSLWRWWWCLGVTHEATSRNRGPPHGLGAASKACGLAVSSVQQQWGSGVSTARPATQDWSVP